MTSLGDGIQPARVWVTTGKGIQDPAGEHADSRAIEVSHASRRKLGPSINVEKDTASLQHQIQQPWGLFGWTGRLNERLYRIIPVPTMLRLSVPVGEGRIPIVNDSRCFCLSAAAFLAAPCASCSPIKILTPSPPLFQPPFFFFVLVSTQLRRNPAGAACACKIYLMFMRVRGCLALGTRWILPEGKQEKDEPILLPGSCLESIVRAVRPEDLWVSPYSRSDVFSLFAQGAFPT